MMPLSVSQPRHIPKEGVVIVDETIAGLLSAMASLALWLDGTFQVPHSIKSAMISSLEEEEKIV
jgi:hypothetical protein